MKNIIKSLVIVVAVAAVASVATWAYFTSQAVVTGQTFSSGTLILNIASNDTYLNGARTTVPFHFDNLKPGDSMRQWITLHNSGTLPIDYLTVDKAE